MKKCSFFLSFILITVLFTSCEEPWQPLFNGENLDGWETFIGTPLKGFEEIHAQAITDKVFKVVDVDGEKLIHITGEVNGSLATVDTFANYHLELVFKWGEQVYTTRNSGLLYHSFGDFGDALGTWMTNIECQLMHENLGDTYLMNNTCCETEATKTDEGFRFSKGGELTQFGKDFNGPGIKKAVDAENPLGEWNTVELYSVGRTTVHVVNGQVTMVNTNTGVNEEDGIRPLSSGKIQIQSEGGDLFIKSVRVKPIKEIPAEILQ
ncbi:DUF1080 domain-containing protein [Draconibacterium sp. IB214405]|uniref:3-keto-disaccharide hydrolase n=1 Tax=Draconibacterium sp. IB214405 TaxID=3097352 RepID=UPI002A1842A7|nr:DUF1080 domain-containing protein [Draconibacterium sp. IB214405]MDX8338475.1 DUF1080 domain-containing protein [Draconibacterium sp. IB214405]